MAKKQTPQAPVHAQRLRLRTKEVRQVRVGDLIGMPENPRTHPMTQMRALQGAVESLGFFDPIDCWINSEGKLVMFDGHARQKLIDGNFSPDELVTVNVTDLTEEEAKQALLTKDPLAGMAEYDPAQLKKLIDDVHFDSPDLQGLIDELAKQNNIEPPVVAGQIADDAIPEAPRVPITKPGDMWILGRTVQCPKCKKTTDV